jgi:hypothetical protein
MEESTIGEIMPTRRRILAVFRSEAAAERAAEALRDRGFAGRHLIRWDLAPGSYLMEDETDPERTFKMRIELVLGGIVGAAVGVALVLVALGGSATPGALIVGAIGGILMGLVAGGVIASGEIPMDDDEDRWLVVTDVTHGHVIDVRPTATTPPRTVHAVLRTHGARGFLQPEAAPEPVGIGIHDKGD